MATKKGNTQKSEKVKTDEELPVEEEVVLTPEQELKQVKRDMDNLHKELEQATTQHTADLDRIAMLEDGLKEKETHSQRVLRAKLLHWEGVDYKIPAYAIAWFRDKTIDNKEIVANGEKKVTVNYREDGASLTKNKQYDHTFIFRDGYCVTNDHAAAQCLVAVRKGLHIWQVNPKEDK